jgi:hypothetical protein
MFENVVQVQTSRHVISLLTIRCRGSWFLCTQYAHNGFKKVKRGKAISVTGREGP